MENKRKHSGVVAILSMVLFWGVMVAPALADQSGLRIPEEVTGDIRSQVAANHVCSQKVIELLQDEGLESLDELADGYSFLGRVGCPVAPRTHFGSDAGRSISSPVSACKPVSRRRFQTGRHRLPFGQGSGSSKRCCHSIRDSPLRGRRP